jgi:hypothetical protein
MSTVLATSDERSARARAAIQRYARVAGLLFVISFAAGGFGEGYVPSKLIVSNDAAATAANILAHPLLFRLGFAGFLIESLCDTAISLVFYVLLRPVRKDIALLAAFFGLLATATFASSQVSNFMSMVILRGDAYLTTFTPDQLNSLALLSSKYSSYGAFLLTMYYGMGWIIRGYLIVRSGYLPKVLGVLMAIGGFGFAARSFLLVLAPAYASPILLGLLFPGGIALAGWLLVRGVDAREWEAKGGEVEVAALA